MLLPASSSINPYGVDIIVASPSACAAFASTPNATQCSLQLPFALPSGTMYYYLGGATQLAMVATPACGS